MAQDIRMVIGHQKMTRRISVTEANYVEVIREQTKTVIDNMEKVIAHVNDVSAEALTYGLKPIYDESQKLVPVDTGRLKRSGYYEVRKFKRGPVAEIGYGRYGDPHYALYVHEIPMVHLPPTTFKFLEKAVDARIEDFRRRVEMFMKRSLQT